MSSKKTPYRCSEIAGPVAAASTVTRYSVPAAGRGLGESGGCAGHRREHGEREQEERRAVPAIERCPHGGSSEVDDDAIK
jgi:hypothetical protein